MQQRVTYSPEAAAMLGLPADAEQVVELPEGFGRFTAAQRRSWARSEIEQVALARLRDLAGMGGRVPSPEEESAYLASVASGIDNALGVRP